MEGPEKSYEGSCGSIPWDICKIEMDQQRSRILK